MKRFTPILLILCLAFALRVHDLTAVPPGLTHDEANHGREAMGVLDGVLLYYFPLNYGSEPLYSYTAAGSMGLLGENLFALRYVNVGFGLLAIAVTYSWARRAFDERVGLITAVLLAVSFWPVASSREALRVGMLPFFVGTAVWVFWRFPDWRLKRGDSRAPRSTHHVLLFGLLIAITFHIYLAARLAWLIFPLFLIYLFIVNRDKVKAIWLPTMMGLMVAGLLVIPMFAYLQNNPEFQTRLGMFSDPLQQFSAEQIGETAGRAGRAFLALFWPSYGDQFLAYNIPGRPTLDVISGLFFVVGLIAIIGFTIDDLRSTIGKKSGKVARYSAYSFLLLWFVVGIAPSLLTGATANTTRNMAALAPIHILPAVGFVLVVDKLRARYSLNGSSDSSRITQYAPRLLLVLWLIFVFMTSSRDYFVRWGQSVEVRGAYQVNLVKALRYWEENGEGGTAVLSTVFPGPAHDSSIWSVLVNNKEQPTRWLDARWGLSIPNGEPATYMIPQSTSLHPYLATLLNETDKILLRDDDLDPNFMVYELAEALQTVQWAGVGFAPINFNNAIHLIDAQWLAERTPAGGVAELLTVWRVADPSKIGPRVLPAEATDAKLFTHVLDGDGNIVAQQDLLSVPSWQWQTGDVVLQVHQIWIAPEVEVGVYETAVGFYSESTGVRVPIIGSDEDRTFVDSLQIGQ